MCVGSVGFIMIISVLGAEDLRAFSFGFAKNMQFQANHQLKRVQE